jgi:hypothetical protein
MIWSVHLTLHDSILRERERLADARLAIEEFRHGVEMNGGTLIRIGIDEYAVIDHNGGNAGRIWLRREKE